MWPGAANARGSEFLSRFQEPSRRINRAWNRVWQIRRRPVTIAPNHVFRLQIFIPPLAGSDFVFAGRGCFGARGNPFTQLGFFRGYEYCGHCQAHVNPGCPGLAVEAGRCCHACGSQAGIGGFARRSGGGGNSSRFSALGDSPRSAHQPGIRLRGVRCSCVGRIPLRSVRQ